MFWFVYLGDLQSSDFAILCFSVKNAIANYFETLRIANIGTINVLDRYVFEQSQWSKHLADSPLVDLMSRGLKTKWRSLGKQTDYDGHV